MTKNLPSIKDNNLHGNVADYLRQTIDPSSKLSIITAYFTIYAYAALKQELDSIDELKLLYGEPNFLKSGNDGSNPKISFRIENDDIELTAVIEQSRVARQCAEWIQNKVNIRSLINKNLLHGKLYHSQASNGVENAIVGSSNFTCAGLGIARNQNIELNLALSDRRDIRDLKDWFDEVWNDEKLVQDVKQEVLAYLKQLYQHNSPEFVYYKTLYHIFEGFLEELESDAIKDREKLITDTKIWNYLFEFQKDGVKGAINKILKYNGCILADSVGLGKTYEALAVIKYFELLNYRVLVLCPKKVRENWTQFQSSVNSVLNPFIEDRFDFTVLSHTDLSRDSGRSGNVDLSTFHWGNYDLVVIDESHNFRNATPDKKGKNGETRKSRYGKLMEDIIKKGVKTKVLLLSATPVNNTLKDLRNQIHLITGMRDNEYYGKLGIFSINTTLETAQRSFTNWSKNGNQSRDKTVLLNTLPSSFFKLLDALSIARSRNHIKRYYAETLASLGGFPNRAKPESIYSEIDSRGEFPTYDELNERISNYRLSLYNPSQYVMDEYRKQYETDNVEAFTQELRENFLIGMMKINFLKRLESSVHSFALTMERTLKKIDSTLEKIEAYQNMTRSAGIDVFEMSPDEEDNEEDEELAEAFTVGSKLPFRLEHMRLGDWKTELEKDRTEIETLFTMANAISTARDAKLQTLQQHIQKKTQNPTRNKSGSQCRKVIVFTAFSDTAEYLYENLLPFCQKELGVHIALVTGGNGCKTTLGKAEFSQILVNFSPISHRRHLLKELPQQEEIDILIATDCVSEGQNLQDCDLMINYDIHWNPVRIIQRFGRIDRIGSSHHEIRLVNFWPTNDLEQYINLKNRVEARMALVDITATGEDDLLNKEGIQDLITEDLKFRDKQLLRLREEVLDLEDFNESVTLSEFTLEDFRMDLLRYLNSQKNRLEQAPLGLNAIVPVSAEYPSIRPGVVFCLRKKDTMDQPGTEKSTQVNPLQPYYLVYILEDGSVRFTFTHAKQILDIFRMTCAGKTNPYDTLCMLFDQKTSNGTEMNEYANLLKKASRSTREVISRKIASTLGNDRMAAIPSIQSQIHEESDLDLITWLVIMGEP